MTLPSRLIAALILLAPPVALIQNRGLVPLAALGTVAVLAALRPRLRALVAALASPPVLAALALALWGVLSGTWAMAPEAALAAGLRLAGLVVILAALVAVASRLDGAGERLVLHAILVASLLCAALVAVETLAAAPLNNALRLFPDPPRGPNAAKPAATLLAVFAGPAVLAAALRAGAYGALAAALALGASVALSTSEAARLALAAAAVAAIVALAFPLLARRALPVALAAIVLAGPPLLEQVAGAATRAGLLPFSAVHRTLIWDYVSERAAERPLLGFGMDSARSLPGGRDRVEAERLDRFRVTGTIRAIFDRAPDGSIERIPLHAHSMPLQVRLELGWVGLGLFALFACLAGRAAAAVPGRAPFAAAVAVAAATSVVSLLSYGVWQHWWWVTVAVASLPLAALRAREER